MKTWVFVEGTSEENMVTMLLRKFLPSTALIIKGRSDFIGREVEDKKLFHIHNSSGVEKIPFDISEYYYLIEKSQCSHVLVVCDVEKKLPCPTKRKEWIYDIVNTEIPDINHEIKIICSVPMIEEIYCDEREITRKVIKKLYKEKYDKPLQQHQKDEQFFLYLDNLVESPKSKISKLMKSAGLTYKESEFSEIFFSQLDYEASKNKTISRLFSLVSDEV